MDSLPKGFPLVQSDEPGSSKVCPGGDEPGEVARVNLVSVLEDLCVAGLFVGSTSSWPITLRLTEPQSAGGGR